MPGKAFTAFVLPLLPVLVLALPGKVVAGPPEGVSGKLVLDKVEDGLRNYRRKKDSERRIMWLRKLAPTHDPRVAIVLGEAMDTNDSVGCEAELLLLYYYVPRPAGSIVGGDWVHPWWDKNEADLRRRAKQLPQ
jgi:hypothetical protein